MSITYVSGLIVILSQFLEAIGITVPVEDLNTTLNTVIALVAGLLVLYGRYRAGGITVAGTRK